ncbi:MAG: DUF3086 domain-containing protein, partial [Cyanobacteria bacterium J06628_4]
MPPEEFSDPASKPTNEIPLPPLRSSSQTVDATVAQLVQAGLQDLETRRQALLREIEQLERRRDRIKAEMRTTFAGASQELAVRLQGFKDYLVGSLQDLATSAEQLELTPPPAAATSQRRPPRPDPEEAPADVSTTAFSIQRFEEQRERVRSLID